MKKTKEKKKKKEKGRWKRWVGDGEKKRTFCKHVTQLCQKLKMNAGLYVTVIMLLFVA